MAGLARHLVMNPQGFLVATFDRTGLPLVVHSYSRATFDTLGISNCY